MNDFSYYLIIGLLDAFLWGGDLLGKERLPRKGPAVLVANHLNARGPIAVITSLPCRVHLWAAGDMMDREKAAAYLNMDFVEPQLRLRPPASLWVSR